MEALAGIGIILLVLFDVFQSIIVPRCTPRTLRIAPLLVGRLMWPNFRKLALQCQNKHVRDFLLGSFGSLAFLALIVTWLSMLITGYAMLLLSVRNQINPQISDLHSALYFAGTSVLTLGFGDIVATGFAAKMIVLSAAVTGVAVMALAVSFLFSLQNAVQKRETVVNTIEARAGLHPSGLHLLLNYARLELVPNLGSHMLSWELWIAEIFESHRAFPFLAYFRSSQCCFTWITALGALLDASNLLESTVIGVARGEAKLFETIAIKSLESLCAYLQLDINSNYVHISRTEFALGLKMLEAAGYQTRSEPEAWTAFSNTRVRYSGLINALAEHFASGMPAWLESSPEEQSAPLFEEELQAALSSRNK